MIESGTPFQKCFQLLIGPKAVDDGQHHHPGLDDAKPLKKTDSGSHGEGCEDGYDQDHRMKNLQTGLQSLVLEFPPKEGS